MTPQDRGSPADYTVFKAGHSTTGQIAGNVFPGDHSQGMILSSFPPTPPSAILGSDCGSEVQTHQDQPCYKSRPEVMVQQMQAGPGSINSVSPTDYCLLGCKPTRMGDSSQQPGSSRSLVPGGGAEEYKLSGAQDSVLAPWILQ